MMKVSLAIILVFAAAATSFILPEESQKRLIKFGEDKPAQWLSQTEVDKLIIEDVGFMDITDHQLAVQKPFESTYVIPTELRYGSLVNSAISRISIARMTNFLTQFSAFNNRYYTAQSGTDSSEFIVSTLQQFIASTNYPGTINLYRVTHSWAQKSVIARIEGENPNSKQVVVLGAHQDSTSAGMPTGRAPGADDDGSGSTTILEAFRALVESGFRPKIAIEFQWYAAEEVGLRGSQDIANLYSNEGIDVVAMTQFDMTGYLSANRRIGLVTDYTDAELNTYIRKLIDGYCTIGWINRTCGYACSDHASFYRSGYKSAFPFEDSSNPNIHTTRDTLDFINFNNIHEFTRLAVGFAIEVAEPRT